MLTICGGFAPLSRFCRAIKPPKVLEPAQAALMMLAPGAAALEYSMSIAASPSSPLVPGSVQLLGPEGGAGLTSLNVAVVYLARPNVQRNTPQSPEQGCRRLAGYRC